MSLFAKHQLPVDRVLAEVDNEIDDVRRRREWLEAHPDQPLETRAKQEGIFSRIIKYLVTPPPRRPAPVMRHDLFEVTTTPMNDLADDPDPIGASVTDPDLFTPPPGQPEQHKLAHYLGAGSLKTFKQLKAVRRRNRRQFLLWLGLSILVVILLWAVVP